MSDQKTIYDTRYLQGYRSTLGGYEFARWKALYHFILKVLKLKNAGKVLDYGSGNGLYIDLWKKTFKGSELFFCDISPVALQQLAEKNPEYKNNCKAVVDGRVDFEDGRFDVVVSIEVMEHVENLDGYLREIHRLLKPGGLFIWTTPCANGFSIEHIYNVLTGQIEKTADGLRRWKWEDPTHLRRLKSAETSEKLKSIGYEKIDFRFRAHLFSFICTKLFMGTRFQRLGERLMLLDYSLFGILPNGASMIGKATKQ